MNLPRIIIYSLLYLVCAYYGSQFYLPAFNIDGITPLWPASGVFLAALIAIPYKSWSYYLVVMGLIQFQQEMLFSQAIPLAAGISSLSLITEATLTAFILRKLFHGHFTFEKLSYVFTFIALSLLVIPLTALPAVWANTAFYHDPFIASMRNWTIGSILGVIVFCPFFVTVEKLLPNLSQIPKQQVIEFMVTSLVIVVVTYYIFQSASTANTLLPSYAYMIMPILVFAAYRYDAAGASTIALLLSVSALLGSFDAVVAASGIANAYEAIPSISLFIFISVSISLIISAAIAERKQANEKLASNAYFDALTGLPNRVLLADRLRQAMAHCHRQNSLLAVAFMDLDGFKAVNDKYGHDVGDELLIAVSLRMQEALRTSDTLARIGGDEFIALMGDLKSFEDSELLLQRLLNAAATPFTLGDVEVQVSVSIGITLYPQDLVDADELMRHADHAMYIAKQVGKNRYHLFDTAQNSAGQIQRKNIHDITAALEKQEFLLHYQPKVNMRTGEVIGVEALIRWQHPERGLVPPLDFLPAAEGHAISIKLGEWVLDTALSQISQWQHLGVNLPISVNMSAYQLQQSNFTERLAALLSTHAEVPPHYLELEILETSELQNTREVAIVMKACHALNVGFSLDDFGTGYSSLTYLKRLPAQMIKIDQSFVRDMLEDEDDLAIVEGVVGLAKAFRRDVIAEGVETVAHGTALLQLGCELAQGYGIARPMPAREIPNWIANWKADTAWRE